MIPRVRAVALAAVLVLASACGLRFPPPGGAPEQDLVAATAARDLPRIRQLLAAGANPNGMIKYQDINRSAWEYALRQARTKNPDTIEIVKAMLKAGANPASVWGGPESRRVGSRREENPIDIAMFNPDPDVIRALMEAGLNPAFAGSALVTAVEQQNVEIVHILVEHGVDVNVHPGANTPLLAAVETRNRALMTYLEEHGAREKP